MWNRLCEKNERYWCVLVLLVSIATHAYSIAVTGAKYWIDSLAYFQLALSLFNADGLGRLYKTEFGFLFEHLTPGLPLLIRGLDSVFHERMWPALAVFQASLSASAVAYFVLAFSNKLSRSAQLAAVFVCGLHPYFATFHAAALTESVSASLLLISVGIAVRALDGRLALGASLTWLLLLSIVAAQFRPYLGLVGILAAAVVVFQLGKPWRIALYFVTALALAVGTLAFPIYRAALGIGFFLPNVSALLLTHVSYVAWDLDARTAQFLDRAIMNEEIRARFIGNQKIDYDDAKRIFDDLIASGLTPAEAKQRIAAAAWRVRTSSIGIIERQLQLPLASIGFQYVPTCCLSNRQLIRSMTASDLYKHIRWYYRWNSGVSEDSYIGRFDRFTDMTRSSHIYSDAAEDFYIARIRPYVTDSFKRFRDPLHLTLFVSDPFVVAAWLGLFLLCWPDRRGTLVILIVPFAVIYIAAAYAHILGDNRHAHPLIPIIVIGLAKVGEEFLTGFTRPKLCWRVRRLSVG
jgi:hypothetical protein